MSQQKFFGISPIHSTRVRRDVPPTVRSSRSSAPWRRPREAQGYRAARMAEVLPALIREMDIAGQVHSDRAMADARTTARENLIPSGQRTSLVARRERYA
jgi:hypothetical protein